MNDPSLVKRYASAAVIIGAVGVMGAAYFAPKEDGLYGIPFYHGGQQYYVRDGSRRVQYPDRETCYREVPLRMRDQCEPVSNYTTGSGSYGRYYGPVYHPNEASPYTPSSQYPSEPAGANNVGKGNLPSSASKYGFGSTGKAYASPHSSHGG